jgi:hypothetical protein
MLTMKINLPQMEIELIPPWNNLYRPFPSSSPALTPPRHLSPPDVAIVCGAEAPASVQQTRPPSPLARSHGPIPAAGTLGIVWARGQSLQPVWRQRIPSLPRRI